MNLQIEPKSLKIDGARHMDLLSKLNESGPYYTSYPTLGLWSKKFGHTDYTDALKDFFATEGKDAPVHLYLHIPFCAKLCWYCICNIQVSNDRAKIQHFLDYLLREIDMLKKFFDNNGIEPKIQEIHLGGGTPSHLYNEQFSQLVERLETLVKFDDLDEVTMEIDPRTTTQENLRFFASKGISRISFGVQDFDPEVQKAINRVQPPELIDALLTPEIRKLFTGVNFDLLYGLPRQTRQTFQSTIELVKKFAPERITLLKYAHVPEVRKHMKLIKEPELPATDQLPLMFTDTVQALLDAGYEWVGIDNFAKPTDDLAKAVREKTVWRTFNGFTPGRTNHLIGLGPTTTGAFGKYYSQAVYDFNDYYKAIDEGKFPTLRGYALNDDDQIRRDVIFRLLCHQTVDFKQLNEKYGIDHKTYFSTELACLSDRFVKDGILEITDEALTITTTGRLLIRNVCKVFDYFFKDQPYKILGP